jgi:hypothetical protein
MPAHTTLAGFLAVDRLVRGVPSRPLHGRVTIQVTRARCSGELAGTLLLDRQGCLSDKFKASDSSNYGRPAVPSMESMVLLQAWTCLLQGYRSVLASERLIRSIISKLAIESQTQTTGCDLDYYHETLMWNS